MFEDKRNAILDWKEIAKIHCEENDFILSKAKELQNSGLKVMDSLFFITTDKRLCNMGIDEIRVVNPIAFINETEE
jgi:hypothetical protein